MDKQKATLSPSRMLMPLLCLLIFRPWVVTAANAQQLDRSHWIYTIN